MPLPCHRAQATIRRADDAVALRRRAQERHTLALRMNPGTLERAIAECEATAWAAQADALHCLAGGDADTARMFLDEARIWLREARRVETQEIAYV